MKKLILPLVFIFTAVVSNQVNAQNSAQASANAAVTLITPIAITKATDLEFGTFVASATPGTITMTPAGSVTTSGGVTEISGGSKSAATFTVSGEAGQSYVITLPTTDVVLSSLVEGESLTLNAFTSNPTDNGVIGTDGTISVGGTLAVPANSKADTYTGSFDVTVNYN